MMPRQPLSEIAMKALTVTRDRVMREGTDLFEELNRIGLIATEPRKQEIRISALKSLRDHLHAVSVDDLLRRDGYYARNSNPPTTEDVRQAVCNWMDEFIGEVEHY